MRPDELERRLRARLDALGPAPRAELLHVLLLPDYERVGAIGSFWANPKTRTFAELLIDCPEKDRTLRAVLVGTLREAERGRSTRRRLRSLRRPARFVELPQESGVAAPC